jgi:hypothetical protein
MSEDEEEKAEHEDEEKEYEETEEKIYRKKRSPMKRKSAPRKKVRKDKTIEKVLKGHTKKGTDNGNSNKGQADRDAIWKSLILGTSK